MEVVVEAQAVAEAVEVAAAMAVEDAVVAADAGVPAAGVAEAVIRISEQISLTPVRAKPLHGRASDFKLSARLVGPRSFPQC